MFNMVSRNNVISLTSLTSLFILQPEDHRPMWYIHTITGYI